MKSWGEADEVHNGSSVNIDSLNMVVCKWISFRGIPICGAVRVAINLINVIGVRFDSFWLVISKEPFRNIVNDSTTIFCDTFVGDVNNWTHDHDRSLAGRFWIKEGESRLSLSVEYLKEEAIEKVQIHQFHWLGDDHWLRLVVNEVWSHEFWLRIWDCVLLTHNHAHNADF